MSIPGEVLRPGAHEHAHQHVCTRTRTRKSGHSHTCVQEHSETLAHVCDWRPLSRSPSAMAQLGVQSGWERWTALAWTPAARRRWHCLQSWRLWVLRPLPRLSLSLSFSQCRQCSGPLCQFPWVITLPFPALGASKGGREGCARTRPHTHGDLHVAGVSNRASWQLPVSRGLCSGKLVGVTTIF